MFISINKRRCLMKGYILIIFLSYTDSKMSVFMQMMVRTRYTVLKSQLTAPLAFEYARGRLRLAFMKILY